MNPFGHFSLLLLAMVEDGYFSTSPLSGGSSASCCSLSESLPPFVPYSSIQSPSLLSLPPPLSHLQPPSLHHKSSSTWSSSTFSFSKSLSRTVPESSTSFPSHLSPRQALPVHHSFPLCTSLLFEASYQPLTELKSEMLTSLWRAPSSSPYYELIQLKVTHIEY